MTVTFTYNGSLAFDRVRLPGGGPTPYTLVEAANKGEAGIGGLDLEDPSSAWSIVGLKDLVADSSVVGRIWSGYLAERQIGRGAGLVVGADRHHDISIVDLNTRLQDLIIQHGKRPAETDYQRVAWLSSYVGYTWFTNSALIDTVGPASVDASDYTGRYPKDVLADCSNASGKTFYLRYCGPGAGGSGSPLAIRLAYHAPIWASNTSTGSISNVPGAADGITVFNPGQGDKLKRDPQRVYSGCYYEYSGGHVYVQNATTKTNYRQREVRATDMTVGKPSSAIRLANSMLSQSSTEEDSITFHLHNVPEASLNYFMAGQRIPITLTEVESYAGGGYMCIQRKTISPITYNTFDLILECANPILTGYQGPGHKNTVLTPSPVAVNTGTATLAANAGQAGSAVINPQMVLAAPAVLVLGGTSVDPLGQNDALPYYTASATGNLTVVADATWPGDNYVQATFNALNDGPTLTTDPFPCAALQVLQLNVTQAALVKNGSTIVRTFTVDWISADGVTVLANSQIAQDTFAASGSDTTLAMTTGTIGAPVLSVANACFARLNATVQETAGHNAANYWNWGAFTMQQLSGGQVVATSFVDSGPAEFMSTVSLDQSSVTTLQAGVQPPNAAPTLSQGLPASLALAKNGDYTSLIGTTGYYDPVGGVSGSTPCYVGVQYNPSLNNYQVVEWQLSDGTVNRTTVLNIVPASIYSITRIGTHWYTTASNGTDSYIFEFLRSTGGTTANLVITSRFAQPNFPVRMTTDGAALYCFGQATTNLNARIVQFSVGPLTYVSTTAMTLPAAPGGAGVLQFYGVIWCNDGDGNGNRFVAELLWDTSTTSSVYQFTTAGVLIANADWLSAVNLVSAVSDGLIWDSTNFRQATYTVGTAAPTLYPYTNWDWTTASAKYWISYSWLDDVGTTHETSVSPRASITMLKRRQLSVTTQAIPTGGVDDPDKVNVYLANGATDPGPTHYHLQSTDALIVRTLVTYNSGGAADGGGTPFPGGTGATLESSDAATFVLLGNGSLVSKATTTLYLPTSADTADRSIAWDSTRKIALVGDATQARPISPTGWLPMAFPFGIYDMSQPNSSSIALAHSVAGPLYSAVLVPFYLSAPMKIQSCMFYCTDTATARAATWRCFADYTNATATLPRLTGVYGTWAFTPTVATWQESNAATPGTILGPGLIWLAIENTSAAQSLDIGVAASGLAGALAETKTAVGTVADITTNDLNTALFSGVATRAVQVMLRGQVFGVAAGY